MQDAAHFQRRYRLTSGQNDVTTKNICETKKEGADMKRGYLYILITTLLFSSMEVALK